MTSIIDNRYAIDGRMQDAVLTIRKNGSYEFEVAPDGRVDMRGRGEGDYCALLHADGRVELYRGAPRKAAKQMLAARKTAQAFRDGRLREPFQVNGLPGGYRVNVWFSAEPRASVSQDFAARDTAVKFQRAYDAYPDASAKVFCVGLQR